MVVNSATMPSRPAASDNGDDDGAAVGDATTVAFIVVGNAAGLSGTGVVAGLGAIDSVVATGVT